MSSPLSLPGEEYLRTEGKNLISLPMRHVMGVDVQAMGDSVSFMHQLLYLQEMRLWYPFD
jgi:hypothetical protein